MPAAADPNPRRSRALVGLALAIGLAFGLAFACGPPPRRESGGGVLLVAVDGLRADHVGVLGYDRDTTPTLDGLAARGHVFAQTFAASPLARPAHTALLTGRDPRLAQPGSGLAADALPHLAVELLAAGYRTAAFVAEADLIGSLGLGRGFQKTSVVQRPTDAWSPRQVSHAPAQVEQALSWLRTVEPGTPWFLYLHLADLERFWGQPPAPLEDHFQPRAELQFVPPVGNAEDVLFAVPFSRWRGGPRTVGRWEADYDGQLRALDQHLARLFAGLRRQGHDARTTVCVVGTHGVQFGEQGLFLRSGLYSVADLHVPWVLRPRFAPSTAEAGDDSAARRHDRLASTLDVAPTLLALEGLAVPARMQGLELPLTATDEPPARAGARPASLVFAAEGLLGGEATIGERYVLEVLDPARAAVPSLARSWFGTEPGASTAREARFYDRRANARPSFALFAAQGASRATGARGELEAAARRWREALDGGRP